MRLHNGSPVQPDAAGCCVGMVGVGASGYAICASEPTTGGYLMFVETGEVLRAFACDRHDVVLARPAPLSVEDVEELNRRILHAG